MFFRKLIPGFAGGRGSSVASDLCGCARHLGSAKEMAKVEIDSSKPMGKKKKETLALSLGFLLLALVGAIPWVVAETDPRYSTPYPDPYGPGYRASVTGILSLIFVSIPTSAISLCCGLIARRHSRLSYLSIIPTSLFLIYCAFVYCRLRYSF